MGYRRKPKVYNLKFQGEEFEGLEVRAKSVDVGRFITLNRLITGGKPDAEDVDSVTTLFEGFAEALLSWNLEDDDGKPVPATLEGLWLQDVDFGLEIIFAWVNAIGAVSAPLGNGSSGGGKSPEALIPMEELSPSPAN